MQAVRRAESITRGSVGIKIPISTAMMEIDTNSSTIVKPRREEDGDSRMMAPGAKAAPRLSNGEIGRALPPLCRFLPVSLYVFAAGVYTAMSLVAFIAYWRDKKAAVKQKQRTPEATLHLLELLGGWPGAFAAQRLIRHKNKKTSYQLVFWGIVLIHAGLWAGWFWLTRGGD